MHECNNLMRKTCNVLRELFREQFLKILCIMAVNTASIPKNALKDCTMKKGCILIWSERSFKALLDYTWGCAMILQIRMPTFTKGTEKKNTQKKWDKRSVWENRTEVKRDKDKICILESLLSPIYAYLGYALLRCTRLLSEFLFVCNQRWNWSIQVLACVPYDKDKVWIRKGYEQGFIGELVTEEDRIERSRGSKI